MSGTVAGGYTTKSRCKTAFTDKHKLTKGIEFKRVFKKPFVSTDPCFKVLVRPNYEDNSRLGMAVSRQVDKKAVGRNRIKRVVRESFRHHNFFQKACLDIVILPRRETAMMSNQQLFQSLQGHWSRLEKRFEG